MTRHEVQVAIITARKLLETLPEQLRKREDIVRVIQQAREPAVQE